MENIWLSIIVPIYNPPLVQLKKSIESAAKIRIPAEILLIDDGSKPEVKQFCSRFKDEKIRYIFQENRGVSQARTTGIQEAQGEYIYFLDSDDAIPQEWIDFLNGWYTDCTADWILFDVVDYDPEKRTYRPRAIFQKKYEILDRKDAFQYILKNANLNECWGKLIRRQLLIENNITFPNGIAQGEDKIFNYRIIRCAQKIEAFNIVGYIYRFELKNTKRLLRNPEKYFSDMSVVYKADLDATEIYDNPEEKNKELVKVAMIRLKDISANVLKLMEANRWTEHEKMLVTDWLQENKLLTLVTLNQLSGFHIKIYYILLKYKVWNGFKILAGIKSILTILRGKNASIL